MKPSDQPAQRRLGTAHLSLAVLAMLSAGWLQSGLTPDPWWQGQIDRLEGMRDFVAAFRLASVACLLLTVLLEWRIGLALRRGDTIARQVPRVACAAYGLVAISALAAIARGPTSRTLLADLDEWLAVLATVTALAGILHAVGLFSKRPAHGKLSPAARPQTSPQRLLLLTRGLALASVATVAALAALETRPRILKGELATSEVGQLNDDIRNEVIVYAALDSEFSEPILQVFTRQTGIAVLPKFDVESTKTVGLTQLIIAERARPRCDLFWNNEILNTLRLEERGLLQAYIPPTAQGLPAAFRAADGNWHGFAARARVLLVNTKLVPPDDWPRSIDELANERWRGRCGLAKPLFGTTATHAACLFASLGPDDARQLFRDIKANQAQIMSGNKQVALAVSAGELAFGLTDTDDAIMEVEQGQPVAIIYPDQMEGALGTLFIPNTLAIIRGGPHPQQARLLVDYLLTPEVENRLADGASAQIPLLPDTKEQRRVETPRTIRAMRIDFRAALEQWDTAAEFLRAEFTTD